MAPIEVIDQTLRDGQQSYWGMRMRAGQIIPVAPLIDAAGYRVVDLTGSSIFEVMVRFREENPWKGLDAIRAAFPTATLRAGARTNGIVGMNVTPDSIVELWVRTLAKHGIGSFWIFDCLHDAENMIRVAKIARDAGMDPSPQLNFSESPVHTDAYYADVIDRMIAGERRPHDHPRRRGRGARAGAGAQVDPPEPGTRERRRRAAGDALPQPHRDGQPQPHHRRRGGGADRPLGDLDPRQRGLDALDRGDRRQPAPARLRGGGRRQPDFAAVAEHFGALADDQGFQRGAPVEYQVANIQQQFPGGMMGTLREQLKQVNMADRLPAVLEEAIQVREEMGWPIMATPFSQLVGIQALLNVVQGERYATIPDENLMYLAGWYGTPPGEVDQEVLDRAAANPRGKQMMDVGHAPQPSLAEIRAEYGENLSDEELLLRYLIPGNDVDNMYAADNPIEPILPVGGPDGLPWIKDVLRAKDVRAISASRGGVRVTLRR